MAGGQQVNTGQGALSPLISGGHGQSATVGQGVVATTVSVALTGLSATISVGTLTAPPPALQLVGQSISAQQQSMAKAVSRSIVGSQVASAQGNLTPAIGSSSVQLTGQQVSISQGQLSIPGSINTENTYIQSDQGAVGAGVSVGITGQQVAASQGGLSIPGGNQSQLGSLLIQASTGITSPSVVASLLGIQIQAGQQNIGPRDVALTGIEIISGQGELGPPRPVEGHGFEMGDFPARRRNKRYQIQVDDEIFSFDTKHEAQAFVDQVAQEAKELAAKQAEAVVAKRQRRAKRDGDLNVKPIALDVPVIKSDGDIGIDSQSIISDIYDEAARTAETRLLLAKRLSVLDEEDELMLLLI